MRCAASIARRRVRGHGGRDAPPQVNSRAFRDRRRCASSRSTSTASARPSARASRAGSRASSRGTSCACRRSSAQHDDVPRALRGAAQVARDVSSGADARATAASRLYAQAPPQVATGFGHRRVRRRRPLSRGAISANLSVISVYLPSGSSGPHRQASKFRFLEAFLPHLAAAARERPRSHPVRRLEHRAPADRPEELAQQPEELRLPAGRARVAHARVRRARLRRRVPPRRPASPTNTRGGRTAARRGRRTSAGASTTRSRRPASPPRRAPRRSTRTGAFPITRR